MNHQNKWLMTSWNTLIVLCATSCSIGLPRVSCQFCSVHPECNPLLSDHYTDLQSHQSCCWLLPIPRELASQGQQRQQGMTQSCSHRPKPIVQRGSNLYELNLSIIMCSSNLRFFYGYQLTYRCHKRGLHVCTFHDLNCYILSLRQLEDVLLPVNDLHRTIGLPLSNITFTQDYPWRVSNKLTILSNRPFS